MIVLSKFVLKEQKYEIILLYVKKIFRLHVDFFLYVDLRDCL
jgi:hypothetical protein